MITSTLTPQVVIGSGTGFLIMIIAAVVPQAAPSMRRWRTSNGRRAILGESLEAGLRNCPPLIGLAILMTWAWRWASSC